jgi:CheY-like chemotaxis protein
MARLLVIDDYAVTQRVLRAQLRTAGHEAVAAGSGPAALELLSHEAFDLVICDISMPEMDGVAVLARIRAEEKTRGLPVIMLTASSDDADRERAKAAGASAFLTKPSSTQELLRVVEACLRS